eukprot:9494245-Alexandrium_andersonii.AAC.1
MLALQGRIQGEVPVDRPVKVWLVEHAGEILAKHLLGHDGRMAFERLFGHRAATTAMRSASACFTAFGRRTWAAASIPGGGPECGWGVVG